MIVDVQVRNGETEQQAAKGVPLHGSMPMEALLRMVPFRCIIIFFLGQPLRTTRLRVGRT